jgi:hypothetical protein
MPPIADNILDVGFEFLIVVVIKSSVFWEIMPCSLLHVDFLLRLLCSPEYEGDMILSNVG